MIQPSPGMPEAIFLDRVVAPTPAETLPQRDLQTTAKCTQSAPAGRSEKPETRKSGSPPD